MRDRRHTLETWQTTWVHESYSHTYIIASMQVPTLKSHGWGLLAWPRQKPTPSGNTVGQHQLGQAKYCGGVLVDCDKTTIVHISKSGLVIAKCCVLANFLT